MQRLARDWGSLKSRYDFVVVGSGYGGSIAAARLAGAEDLRSKPTVAMLERGREWPLETFPDTFERFAGELRSSLNPLGLFDIQTYHDISVIKGNGLGGTSLINANVAIVPDDDAFRQAQWPDTLTRETLKDYYEKAFATLNPSVHPRFGELKKIAALRTHSSQVGLDVEPLKITVNFEDRADNGFGIPQAKCTDCGDCVTGCRVGAKNTLYMNYLQLAARKGAEIFTQTEVEWIERVENGGWRVHGAYRQGPDKETRFTIDAANVILAAGSIGTTGILLRSAERGLSVSARVGTGFTGNGDFFGLAYNGREFLQVLGFGKRPESPGSKFPPGPTITGVVRHNADGPLNRRFLVEDVSYPRALVNAAQIGFVSLHGEEFGRPDEGLEKAERALRDLFQVEPHSPNGALNHSLLYLVTSIDNAGGRIVLRGSGSKTEAQVEWEGAGRQEIFGAINDELRQYAASLGARFVANPTWAALGMKRLVTAHPLGGCPIGEDHRSGAVDEFGRVFSSDGAVHKGLLVADGALIPAALGVNPFMTISAIAERAIAYRIDELRGKPYPVARPDAVFAAGATNAIGLVFEEEMTGWFAAESAAAAAAAGGGAPSVQRPPGATDCSFRVQIEAPDLDKFLADPDHRARMRGVVRFGQYQGVAGAEFHLDDSISAFKYLRRNPETGQTEMDYQLGFHAGGTTHTLHGRKFLHRDAPTVFHTVSDALYDFTTLFVRLDQGVGVLKFRTFEDVAAVGSLIKFVTGFRVTRAPNPAAELAARAKFLAFTGRFLLDEYGLRLAGLGG